MMTPFLVALGAALAAQAPPAAEPAEKPPPAVETASESAPGFVVPTLARLEVGLGLPHVDTRSSKFEEYRAVPHGLLIPFVHVAGERSFAYELLGQDVLQDDARYRAAASRGALGLEVGYTRIPHALGNDARSILDRTSRSSWEMSATLQRALQGAIEQQRAISPAGVNFAFLSALMAPSLVAQDPFDLRVLREQGRVDLDLTRGRPVDLRLSYYRENRRGNRNSGTSFGFGNVVETTEPIDHRTQDLSLSAEWTRPWGLLRGAVRMNLFDNRVEVQTFDNPFRAVDSTDPNAYQAPGSASINGPRFGRIALAPDNRAVTGSVGGSFRFGRHTRVSADASLGQWTQDEAFIPFASNTAITSPVNASDPAALPARSLDGKIRVSSLSATVSSRPARNLTLTGRVRTYELDNQTPRIEFPLGYARFDAAWNANGRISVPYGYGNDRALASAAYTFGPVNLEGGWRFDRWDRTFRDTEETTEHTFFASTWARPRDWAMVRASLERGHRDFDAYDTAHSEHASFLGDVAATNQLPLRRFDQAVRDRTRAAAMVQLSPWGNSSFGFSYSRARDDYDESPLGLLEADNTALSFDADYSPSERLTLFGYFTREDIRSFQRGRQSAATPSSNPADDWTADIEVKSNTFGLGGRASLVRDKVDLTAQATWQEVDGFNDLFSPPGGTPDFAVPIPDFDDTKILTLSAELQYRFSARWRVGLGGWLEDYEVSDAQTVGLPNYAPGAFYLAPFDGNYTGGSLYTRLIVTW